MIRIFLLLSGLLGWAAVAGCQEQAPQISFALGRARIESGLSNTLQNKVERQLSALLTSGADTYGAPYAVFVVAPVLSLLDQGKIEGVATRITARVNLQLRVANNVSGEVFHTSDLTLTGAGATLDEAVGKALQGVRPNNPALRRAMEESRVKIREHYTQHCDQVQKAAAEKESAGQFAAALSLLHSIPEGTPCFEAVQAKKTALFAKIQEQECRNLLQKADARVAAKDFAGALHWLAQIDSQSPCAPDAKQRIATVETKVDEQERTRNEWLFKYWSAGQDAEKARWNALTTFCLEWLHGNAKYELAPW